jgi:hypothetical protein
LRPDLQPYFNLEPGALYRDRDGALAQLDSLPFVPGAKIERRSDALTAVPDIQFPLERLVSATRPLESWAAHGEHKMRPDGQRVESINNALMFADSGIYRDRPEPIQVALFTDSTGEVWGRVGEGISRTMAAKLAGDRNISVTLHVPEDLTQMDHYPGDVVGESSGRRFYDPGVLSDAAVQAVTEGRDIRDVQAEQASADAWAKWQAK